MVRYVFMGNIQNEVPRRRKLRNSETMFFDIYQHIVS
jgi:hypothetical protein